MSANHVEDVFLLVNPKSGGGMGDEILRCVPEAFEVELSHGRVALLRSFSLTKEEGSRGNQACFDKVKGLLKMGVPSVRLIVAGGDGTIKWVVSEAQKHGVDPGRSLLIGILPLGTGNDFSRSTGWGGKFPRNLLTGDLENLADRVRRYCNAASRAHDVWQLNIKVDEDFGAISKVGASRKREIILEKSMQETMIMYFSIGTDGQMGIGFDKKRTSSRFCNFCVYAWESLKKSLPCRRRHRVADVVSGLYHGKDLRGRLIFCTDRHSAGPHLASKPQMLTFTNISSYGGGCADPWRGATRLGVSRALDARLVEASQDPGDGKLEVVTFRNLVTVGLDALLQKVSFLGPRRIFSGAPLFLHFIQADEEDNDIVSYCQIDGEFFKLVNPSDVLVTQSLRLQVLHNEDWQSTVSSSESSSEEDEESAGCCWPSILTPHGSREPTRYTYKPAPSFDVS